MEDVQEVFNIQGEEGVKDYLEKGL